MVKKGFKKLGAAQSIATKAKKPIYVTARRPTVRVIQQEGANFEVKRVRGGQGIFVGGAGSGGSRNPSMPAVDFAGYNQRINEMIAQKRQRSRLFVGGERNYDTFIKSGTFIKRDTFASRPGKAAPTTVSTKALLVGKLRVVPVSGGGRVGWKPWSENFFLWHPIRTLTNAVRWAKNPLARKAETRELESARTARTQTRLEPKITKLQRRYEKMLKDNIETLRLNYAQLEQAYTEMVAGRMAPGEFNLQRDRFMLSLKEYDEIVEKANKIYEQGRFVTARQLWQRRGA